MSFFLDPFADRRVDAVIGPSLAVHDGVNEASFPAFLLLGDPFVRTKLTVEFCSPLCFVNRLGAVPARHPLSFFLRLVQERLAVGGVEDVEVLEAEVVPLAFDAFGLFRVVELLESWDELMNPVLSGEVEGCFDFFDVETLEVPLIGFTLPSVER